MTSGKAGTKDAAQDGLEEDQIAAYLRAHPDFFDRHSEVLAELRIPHETGEAVSLIERQLGLLREQLQAERRRLTHFINRARNYETLATRLHNLVLKLIVAPDFGHIEDVLRTTLRRELGVDAVTLKLFPMEPGANNSDPVMSTFREFLDREHALCGPLDGERDGTLFGDLGATVQSAALIPIRANGRSGVLAIGSCNAQRFTADMGTELLDRLGEILSYKLKTVQTPRG